MDTKNEPIEEQDGPEGVLRHITCADCGQLQIVHKNDLQSGRHSGADGKRRCEPCLLAHKKAQAIEESRPRYNTVETVQGVEFNYGEWLAHPLLDPHRKGWLAPNAPSPFHWTIGDVWNFPPSRDRVDGVKRTLCNSLREPERYGEFSEVWKSFSGMMPHSMFWECALYTAEDGCQDGLYN